MEKRKDTKKSKAWLFGLSAKVLVLILVATVLISIPLLRAAGNPEKDDSEYEPQLLVTATESTQCISEEPSKATENVAFTEAPETATVPLETVPVLLNEEPGTYIETFFANTTDYVMDYCLFMPEMPVEGMPLIVFLHDGKEVGNVNALKDIGMISQAKQIYGDDFPFIGIAPCTWTDSWTADDISVTLKELIDSVAEKYFVDKDHIVVAGHGIGALGVWNVVGTYGDYFSAAAPISGKIKSFDAAKCAEVPIWAFTGDADAVNATKYEESAEYYMEKAVARINEVGGQAMLTVLEGSSKNDMLTKPYSAELFKWMLEQ